MSLFVRDTSPAYDRTLWVLDHMALSLWEMEQGLRSEPGTLGWFCVTTHGVETWVNEHDRDTLYVRVPEGTELPDGWEQFLR